MSQRLARAGWLELAVTIGLYNMLGESSLSRGEPDLLFRPAARHRCSYLFPKYPPLLMQKGSLRLPLWIWRSWRDLYSVRIPWSGRVPGASLGLRDGPKSARRLP